MALCIGVMNEYQVLAQHAPLCYMCILLYTPLQSACLCAVHIKVPSTPRLSITSLLCRYEMAIALSILWIQELLHPLSSWLPCT